MISSLDAILQAEKEQKGRESGNLLLVHAGTAERVLDLHRVMWSGDGFGSIDSESLDILQGNVTLSVSHTCRIDICWNMIALEQTTEVQRSRMAVHIAKAVSEPEQMFC